MTIETAIEKAIEGGYARQQSYYAKPVSFTSLKSTNEFFTTFETNEKIVIEDGEGGRIETYMTTTHQTSQIFLDPLFWQSLYGSEKYGRIKALEFVNAIFDGKSAENFFEQEPDLGEEQQEKTLS